MDKKNKLVLPGSTIPELLQHWAKVKNWTLPAFVSVDKFGTRRAINHREVLVLSSRFSERLREKGIKKGIIVCNTLPNSLERVVCEFGIICSGATSMNGQVFRSSGSDFIQSLKTAKCDFVVVDSGVSGGARSILQDIVPTGSEENPNSFRLPDLKGLILCNRSDVLSSSDFITSLKNDSENPGFIAEVMEDDVATIMTTSGSTGYSKLVQLSHKNICHFALQVKAIEPFEVGDRFINTAPLGWAGGYPQWYLSSGVTRYILDARKGLPQDVPAAIWNIIVEEKIIYGFISPLYVNEVAKRASLWESSEWKPKVLCLAGQPVKNHLVSKILGKLCKAVDINYGATECNLISTHRITEDQEFKDNCAGYPGFGVSVKVVNHRNEEVAKGCHGEVLVKAPSLTKGYLCSSPGDVAVFTSDGWFHTDDLGYIGEDNKLYVDGRQSDAIMRGAYILYPGWLEEELRKVEEVKDVVVVPVPDPVLHNEICAVVVTDKVNSIFVGPKTMTDNHLSARFYKERPMQVKDKANELDICGLRKLEHDLKPEQISFIHSLNRDKNLNTNEPGVLEEKDQLEQTRRKGANTPLTTTFNASKIRFGDVQESGLMKFERKLIKYCSDLMALDETDSMRMQPKYFVFINQFPLTNTGKLNRKKIQELALSELRLPFPGKN